MHHHHATETTAVKSVPKIKNSMNHHKNDEEYHKHKYYNSEHPYNSNKYQQQYHPSSSSRHTPHTSPTSSTSTAISDPDLYKYHHRERQSVIQRIRAMPRSNKKRDPLAPKRNLSAYLLYQNAMRDTFRARNPGMDFGQLAKYTSAMFAEMPHCEKVMWHMRAKEDKARYIKQIAEYKPSPGYDAKGDITEAGAILYGISLKTNSRSKTSANNVALAQANGKPRPKKDKNAPKRNLSAFLLYQNYMRHVFNKNPNSNSSFGDIATYSSQTFKTLSVEEKAYWTQMAEEDKARYEKEAAMYNPPPGYDRFGHLREHANGSSTADAAASSGADGSKKKRRKKRSPRDTTAPKRSSGAYVFFTNEFRPKIWGEQPDLKFVELGRVLGAKWRALTPKEKMPYEALANQDKARYQSEMQEYNRKKLDRERAERRVLDAEQDAGGVNVNVNVGNLEDEGMSKIPPSLPVSMPDVGMNLNMGMNMGMNMNIPAIPPIPPPSATSPAAAHAHAHTHGFSPLHVHDVNVNVNDIHQQHEEHPPINDASAHAHVPSPPAHGFGVDVGVAVGSPSPMTAVEGTDTELNLKREAATSPNGSFYAA